MIFVAERNCKHLSGHTLQESHILAFEIPSKGAEAFVETTESRHLGKLTPDGAIVHGIWMFHT